MPIDRATLEADIRRIEADIRRIKSIMLTLAPEPQDDLFDLLPATLPGGILYENPEGVKTSELRNHSKAWRRLLTNTRHAEILPQLKALGVECFSHGRGVMFRLIPKDGQ